MKTPVHDSAVKHWGLAALLALVLAASTARSEVSFGLSAGPDGLNSFYLEIGNYYHVAPEELRVVRQRHLPDDEMPVAFFIAQRAHLAPLLIVNERLGGLSWMEICLRHRLDAGIFYVPWAGSYYGRYKGIYAHYRIAKRRWHRIRLRDDEIVNLVNMRFLHEHYGYSQEEIGHFRDAGRHFYQARRREAREDRREERREDWRDDRRERRADHRKERRGDNGRHLGQVKNGGGQPVDPDHEDQGNKKSNDHGD